MQEYVLQLARQSRLAINLILKSLGLHLIHFYLIQVCKKKNDMTNALAINTIPLLVADAF